MLDPAALDALDDIEFPGTRRGWSPARFPEDPVAAQRLREWIASEEGGIDAVRLELSGADLSHADFSESWFCEAKCLATRLAGCEFYRSHAEGADLSQADLTESSLVRINLDEAILRGTILDRANLVGASLCDVDASDASCCATQFGGSSLLGVDFSGANLSDAQFDENSFKVKLNGKTILRGATGTVFGPVEFTDEGQSQTFSGIALQSWLRDQGADIRVIEPRWRT